MRSILRLIDPQDSVALKRVKNTQLIKISSDSFAVPANDVGRVLGSLALYGVRFEFVNK